MYPNFDIDPRSESFSIYKFIILIQEPSFLYTNFDIDPSSLFVHLNSRNKIYTNLGINPSTFICPNFDIDPRTNHSLTCLFMIFVEKLSCLYTNYGIDPSIQVSF